jgi:hypothetical protein
MTHAGHELVHNPEQANIDLSKEDDDESINSQDSGSSISITPVMVKRTRLTPPFPPPHR